MPRVPNLARLLLLCLAVVTLWPATAQARVYNPQTGRFLQRDPLGVSVMPVANHGGPLPGIAAVSNKPMVVPGHLSGRPWPQPHLQYSDGMNLYQYVQGNPLRYTDPPGTGPLKWLYTGDWNASDEVYDAALGGAASTYGVRVADNVVVGSAAGAATGAAVGAGVGAGVGAIGGAGVGAVPGAGAGAVAGGVGGAISGGVAALFSDPDASLGSSAVDGVISGAIDGVTAGVGTKFLTPGKAAVCAGDDVARQAAHFFDDTRLTQKVLDQMRLGDYHAFPRVVENFAENGAVRTIRGGDGVARDMLEIFGSYRGRDGVFEFIRESDGLINHRLFRPGP